MNNNVVALRPAQNSGELQILGEASFCTSEAVLQLLRDKGYSFSSLAQEVILQINFSTQVQQTDFVYMTTKNLLLSRRSLHSEVLEALSWHKLAAMNTLSFFALLIAHWGIISEPHVQCLVEPVKLKDSSWIFSLLNERLVMKSVQGTPASDQVSYIAARTGG